MSDHSKTMTGSPHSSEPVFLTIGHLQRPHGVAGEIAMQVITDFPERIRKGKTVFLGTDYTPIKILQTRWKQDLMLIKFEGYSSREEVAKLTNLDVFTRVKDLPSLPAGEYYHHQLIGLQVFEGDTLLGTISEILVTGANDVYVVSSLYNSEILLPAIESGIISIDLEANRMQVIIPDGLIE